jgi:hypothetical protein
MAANIAEKIIQFQEVNPKKAKSAWQRLSAIARRKLTLDVLFLFYIQWNYGITPEDIGSGSSLILMSWILYPSYKGVPNPYNALNYDIITVNSRPAEQFAFHEVAKYEGWKNKKRIVLYPLHKHLMDAERQVLKRRAASSIKEAEYVGSDGETYTYSYTEIHWSWVYEEMQQLLASWNIPGVTQYEIINGLELIENAYSQADALGYEVKFVLPFQAERKLAKVA